MVTQGVSKLCAGICTAQHTYKGYMKGVIYEMTKCADAGKLQRVKRQGLSVKNCMRPLQEWLLN